MTPQDEKTLWSFRLFTNCKKRAYGLRPLSAILDKVPSVGATTGDNEAPEWIGGNPRAQRNPSKQQKI